MMTVIIYLYVMIYKITYYIRMRFFVASSFLFNHWMCPTEFAACVLPFSSVHMEESSVMQGAQGMLVQNWPTVSSAAGE